jgi:hypothetical protein
MFEAWPGLEQIQIQPIGIVKNLDEEWLAVPDDT